MVFFAPSTLIVVVIYSDVRTSNLKHTLPYGQDQMKEYQLCLDLPRGAVKKMWEGQDPIAHASVPIVFG